ncbi:hypothetical protein [Clostridium sardiniense]|nr:hypothetical protein [Clostridium sardiniense]MDQ0461563.1 hypothetical protein [Clostridium sardiniense]
MNPLYYLLIGLPLIFVIILIFYNISTMKKSRDKALNKKRKFK